MEKAAKPVAFRPSALNQERLDYARKLGADVSKILNEILEEHLKPALERVRKDKAKEMRETLSAPVP